MTTILDSTMALFNMATEDLSPRVKGRVLFPADAQFDAARQVWNAMIDRRPAVIVQCAGADDIVQAIRFARQNGLDISIRGGGHNIAGNAVCDGGLMIDLSTMTDVRVDAVQRCAYVQPGARLADVDAATQKHGLATPLGINSTTGIAGLTLGGGFGWLTRKHGLTVDNLVSADMITAEGMKLRASDDENEDLFWAIRGGGGNFGVVTQFEYQLHPVGPEILAGLFVYPFDQARQVLRRYREYVAAAPEELCVWVVLRQAPPLPFLPAEVHGREVVILPVFYAGDAAEGQKRVAPLRKFGDLHGEHIAEQPYSQWQQAFDPLLSPGARNYWKSHNFSELHDDTLDTVITYAARLPSPQCEIFVGHLAGAANQVPSNSMAYGHRDARFVMNVHGRWDDAVDDKAGIAWARAFFEAAAPHASSGAYINFMSADEGGRVAAAFGANYERLAQIKKKYDPQNVFHINQNIRP